MGSSSTDQAADDLKMPALTANDTPTPSGLADDAPTMSSTPPADEPKPDTDDDQPADSKTDDYSAADESDDSHGKDDDKKADDSTPAGVPSTGSPELDSLKASALDSLRPLVGKLNLPAEERFDTLLLIIRSTDDQSLLQQAHDAAKEITDDARRAQALLDVIKEIDYFSSKRG